MEWFSSWFNSPYYHLLYKNRSEEEATQFVAKINQFFQITETDKILDLACGKGRHSINLQKTGADVWGLDIAPESIAYANQFAHEKLYFGVHDMRDSIPNAPFNYIFNLFTSFGYFETEAEEQLSIQNMSDALAADGKLLIDFLNIGLVQQCLIPQETKEIEGVKFKISKKIENRFIIKDIQFTDKGTDYQFQEKVKALWYQDFDQYLQQAGLQINQVFGDYELNEFDLTTSPRLILVCSKVAL